MSTTNTTNLQAHQNGHKVCSPSFHIRNCASTFLRWSALLYSSLFSSKHVNASTIEGNHFSVLDTANGREMVCSIDAKPGDLIFCEQAFAICPETSFIMNKQFCFMCCKDLRIVPTTNNQQSPTNANNNSNSKTNKNTKEATNKVQTPSNTTLTPTNCPTCTLAFCSAECVTNPLHALECGLIPKVCATVIEADKQNVKLDLSTMRHILLKGKIDSGYKQIEGMLAHIQDHSEAWRKKYEIFAELFCKDLPSESDGSRFFSAERIVELACLLDTNAFGGRSHTTSHQLSTGLFYYAALLNHTCDPNVIYSVVDDKITMRAIKDIPKGTPLNDTYVDLLFPTRERQSTLLKSKSFFCTCLRYLVERVTIWCCDPTEQGRYLAAWKCNKEGCEGFMVPSVSFVKETKEITQTWSCENCDQRADDTAEVPTQVQRMRDFLAKRTWNADAAKFVPFAAQLCVPVLARLHTNHHLRLFFSLETCNALRTQRKFSEAIPFMNQVCRIVSKVAPNTIQEVDCQYQLGQIYAQAHAADRSNAQWAQESRNSIGNAVRIARVCLGPHHPHTLLLNKQYLH